MTPIRVLVVDDSVVGREFLAKILESEPDIEVVGTAENRLAALGLTRELSPDLEILDIEMPIMNGLETVSALRTTNPHLPILMFSTLTEEGGTMTMDALQRGASDYITIPEGVSVKWRTSDLKHSLSAKVRELALSASSTRSKVSEPGHEEAFDGALLENGSIWTALGCYHIIIKRRGDSYCLLLNQEAPENSYRPPIDPFFRSSASLFKDKSLAPILAGMGKEGVAGAKDIHQEGGSLLVQDKGSSVIWGMPGLFAQACIAQSSLMPQNLAVEINLRARTMTSPTLRGHAS